MQDNDSTLAQDPQALMLEDHSITEFLEHLALLGEQLFDGTGSVVCGVMSHRGNKPTTVSSSSPMAAALNEAHQALGEGPSLHAMTAGEVVVVADASKDGRWIGYLSMIAAEGYLSVLSVPLMLGPEGAAAINFYATGRDFFTRERQRVAGVFAVQAEKALEMAMRVARHEDKAANMRAAMESRTSIDIALGIIIGQNHCTQDQAFEILHRASNNRNKKIRDVARDLIVAASGATPVTSFDN